MGTMTRSIHVRRGMSVRESGGARRDRTADLLHAMQALSQLSYGPTCWNAGKFNERPAAPSSNSTSGAITPTWRARKTTPPDDSGLPPLPLRSLDHADRDAIDPAAGESVDSRFRRIRVLRRHWRSRLQENISRVAGPDPARRAGHADHRCRP